MSTSIDRGHHRTGNRAAASPMSIERVPPTEWERLRLGFANATVFHSLGWLRSVQDAHGLALNLCKAVHEDRCVAIWPYLVMNRGPLRIGGSPLPGWSTPYLGPLFAEGSDVHAILGRIIAQECRQFSYFATKVLDRFQPIDLSAFGFQPVMRYDTYLLDLSRSEEAIWKRCDRKCRNHVRKGQKSRLDVQLETDPAFIDEFWTMTQETFAKSGVCPTFVKPMIHNLWKELAPSCHVRFLSAFHSGQRVATVVLLSDEHTMYYWAGASYPQYRHLSANNLLQWEAIRMARAMGLRTYDFISTTGGPGVFKASFGPEKVDVSTHWERSSSRLMNLLKNQYVRLLRRRQRLPG